jgi:hypothetical protein
MPRTLQHYNIKTLLLPVAIISVGFFVSYLIIAQAQAPDIVYPVKELGNCKDEVSCRNFCEVKENMIPCVNFAEQRGLISKEEAKVAKEFARMGKGPGGCQGREECEVYCDDNAHIEECLAFAEENNLIPPDELEEAKKVAKALREGAQLPGGCKRKSDCEAYCDNPENIEECIAFAERAGFIPPDELEGARKAVKAMKSGIKPPGNCRGKKQCDAYCSEPSNMEECMRFALDAGFISEQERPDAEKMLSALKRGVKPLPCRGKDACETYCQEESHQEECVNFALEAGFMKPEEAEMFRKTGGKGPGGCKGKEQCETFCNDQANQEICFNFAKEHNLIPQEEIEKMREGMTKLREGMQMAPPEVHECLKSTVGTEILDRIQAGNLTPGPQIGDQVRKCFEQFMPRPPEGTPGGMPPMPPSGPMTPGGPEGMIPPEVMTPEMTPGMTPGRFKGPGGCSSPEECQRYCSEHPEECMKWGQQGMTPPQGMMSNPEMIQKMMQKMMQEGIKPPEGMMMPEGMMPPPPPPSEPPPPTGSNVFR